MSKHCEKHVIEITNAKKLTVIRKTRFERMSKIAEQKLRTCGDKEAWTHELTYAPVSDRVLMTMVGRCQI